MGETSIEWTHIPGYKAVTWNPVVGCSVVSPGCKHCYAMVAAGGHWLVNSAKYAGLTQPTSAGPVWTGEVRKWEKALFEPLSWRKPRAVFVNSMGDLFHENVPLEWIGACFAVMAACPDHIFIVLTKRSANMRETMAERLPAALRDDAWRNMVNGPVVNGPVWDARRRSDTCLTASDLPLPNVWMGPSCEDQKRADERIPDILQTPAAVRLISAEPLLGPIDLTNIGRPVLPYAGEASGTDVLTKYNLILRPQLDWIIVGYESGPGHRPGDPAWARGLRDQCVAAGVPFFFKQWGGARPKAGGRLLDGRTWSQFPEVRDQGSEARGCAMLP